MICEGFLQHISKFGIALESVTETHVELRSSQVTHMTDPRNSDHILAPFLSVLGSLASRTHCSQLRIGQQSATVGVPRASSVRTELIEKPKNQLSITSLASRRGGICVGTASFRYQFLYHTRKECPSVISCLQLSNISKSPVDYI